MNQRDLPFACCQHLHLKLLRLGLASSKDVLLQDEQQKPLPVIPRERQRSTYQLVGCTARVRPLAVASASCELQDVQRESITACPARAGEVCSPVEPEVVALLHPCLKLPLKLNSPADCSREPEQCQLHPLQNLQAMRKGREQAVKKPENVCKIHVSFLTLRVFQWFIYGMRNYFCHWRIITCREGG